MMSFDVGSFYPYAYSSSPPFGTLSAPSVLNGCRTSSREIAGLRKDWSPVPKRSCMTSPNENDTFGCVPPSANNIKNKLDECDSSSKKVTFADAKGLALAYVKIFDSDEENDLMLKSISATFRNIAISEHSTHDNDVGSEGLIFEMGFTQPAAEYADFRKKLDINNVCLENVIVQGKSICGTVKVKNISFHKKVGVRITYDGWQTSSDHDGRYLNNNKGHDLYDTFSFKVPLPACWEPKQNVQFCIFYTIDGAEFWDNNSGDNYRIKSFFGKRQSGPMSHSAQWTEFQFWKVSFDDERPYW